MANNCLVTKLKDVVINDNLRYFNTVVAKVDTATQSDDELRFYISPITGKTLDATIRDQAAVFYDTTFNVYGKSAKIIGHQSLTDDGKQLVYVTAGEYDIHIKNAIDLKYMYLGSGITVDIIGLRGCDGIETLTGRIAPLKCSGDVANLADCTGLITAELGGADCFGDITSLAKCINLTNLDVRTSSITSPNGHIHDLFASMVQIGGRNSGTLKCWVNGNLGTEGTSATATFYPISPEHPNGYERI